MGSKPKNPVLSLVELREYCGTLQNGHWLYMPPRLQDEDSPRPVEDFAALIDKRSIGELHEQLKDGICQLLRRAHGGDDQALAEFVTTARRVVLSLKELAKFRTSAVRALAERAPDWPVMIGLNAQDIARAKHHLTNLGVGTKSLKATRNRHRIDRRQFWTHLAERAYDHCQDARVLVPNLQRAGMAGKRTRITRRVFNTDVPAKRYILPGGDMIIIPDYTARAARLSDLTEENFKGWWSVMKLCILEFWSDAQGRENYELALANISYADAASLAQKRAYALNQIQRSFRNLVGLPVQQKPPSNA